MQLPGSPFRLNVIDPEGVRIIGGWSQYLDDSGNIKLPAKLAFDISNAGPGTLECKVAGRKVNPEKTGSRVRFDLSGKIIIVIIKFKNDLLDSFFF